MQTTKKTLPQRAVTLRRANARGHANHGWLDSHHTFSFADYHDPAQMGFRALRVINDDRVAPGAGFPTHPHRDMEIVSYVVEGALEHKDSEGNGSVIVPGDVQRMSAGSGIRHSEYNHSKDHPVRFLQIWILPNARGGAPGYEQKHFPPQERRGALRLVASADGQHGSVALRQDVRIHAGLLAAADAVTHSFAEGRHGWLQIVRGNVRALEHSLGEGDGLALSGVSELPIVAGDSAEFLLFDLA
ncbi:MAG TPA: pirin family protein [Polyangiaceae bacterium]|nr:pirin family protein [Polyangiaceae bacterium]HMR75464.1 pirin family protein [Polyangiaceae bacterium]